MISDFSVRPTPQNGRAKYLTVAALIGATASFIVYANIPKYKGLVGLVSLACIVAAVFIYSKYIATSYTYDIVASGGEYLFVVKCVVGKRITTLCRIDLGSIVKVERETPDTRREHKSPSGFVSYSYCPTLGPDVTYLITSTSRYERAEIRIEANDDFARLLTEWAAEARALTPSDDE